MNLFYIFYFSLIAVAALLSYWSLKKGNEKSFFLMVLLIATFFVEVSSRMFSIFNIQGYSFILHIFNILEYTMFGFYYLKSSHNNKLKRAVKLSISLFAVLCTCVSFFVYHYKGLPVINIDVEGFLLFIVYTHLLFSLDVDENRFIYTHPDFWISIGILIFYGGVFVFLGLYPILLHLDTDKALKEYGFIMTPLNVVLYNSIILGLICSIRNKKYLTQ
jgi:hypothetical protein